MIEGETPPAPRGGTSRVARKVGGQTTMLAAHDHRGHQNDADLARAWLGSTPVDTALGDISAGRHQGTLATWLAERGLVNAAQQEQLGAIGPVMLLGDFELRQSLGSGAMGEVWLARQLGSGKLVAIKTIKAKQLDQNGFLQRFDRESEVLEQLHHPHIARAIARGVHDDVPWLAMEYVQGPTLDQVLREQGRLEEADALRLVVQVAKGLDYAYESASLIHRDIKPGNILLDRSKRPEDAPARPVAPEDQAKIIDFGLAKSLDAGEGEALTMTGTVMGTPSYMSPEQIQGEKDLDHRTDQYALAATLFQLLTGAVPYPGTTNMKVFASHVHDPIPDPGKIRPDLSQATRTLVMTGLAKRRGDRFKGWHQFVSAGERALRDLGTGQAPSTNRFVAKPLGPKTPAIHRPTSDVLPTNRPPSSLVPIRRDTPPPAMPPSRPVQTTTRTRQRTPLPAPQGPNGEHKPVSARLAREMADAPELAPEEAAQLNRLVSDHVQVATTTLRRKPSTRYTNVAPGQAGGVPAVVTPGAVPAALLPGPLPIRKSAVEDPTLHEQAGVNWGLVRNLALLVALTAVLLYYVITQG